MGLGNNEKIIPGFNNELSNELKIELIETNSNNIIMIDLIGYIDTYNSQFFSERMKLVLKKYSKIIFNFSRLNYLSSTGIGTFTNLYKDIKKDGGNLTFIGVQPRVYDIFQLLGFTSFFKFSESIEEALEYLSESLKSEDIFPTTIQCPICNKKLRARKAGKFKCPECKQIIQVLDTARVKII